ncbi:MAG: phenylalanine--tRNA ligase subunit beta [Candidatus Aenigmarchaeota archaeon]|nr:phenylalanine--tRNA ligase subunit beta [Candidatus Aenigmarchaeota archaeon]
MPTIELSHSDLCSLMGTVVSVKDLEENVIMYAKGEVEEIDGDNLKIDIKDTNRPDLWSAEGIAREIKFRLSPGKLPKYKMKKSGRKILVSKEMKNIRPLIAAAIVKDIVITEELLLQMIHLQDKVDETFGRKRKEVAIGIYDYDKVKGDIEYRAADPNKVKFVPLEFKKELSLKEILNQHPKGKAYAHLIRKYPKYPLLADSEGDILSMPPVINSNYSGKVEETTKNLMIEVTGYSEKYVSTAISVLAAALSDRGGKPESVEIVYPDRKVTTPNMKPKSISIDIELIRKISGLDLTNNEIYDLLKKSGYGIKSKSKKTKLLYPAYRQDVMHPIDVVEDVIISYGYGNVEVKVPEIATTGKADETEVFSKRIAEVMVGLGMQEILSYTLTNKNDLFGKMNKKEEPIAEIENIVSSNWSVFRNWLLPSVLEFLLQNKHIEYPQEVFEIGDCVVLDNFQPTKTRNVRKLAGAITNSTVNYEQIASYVDALISAIGIKYKLRKTNHPSFVNGRCAEIFVENKSIGFVGEISPKVLNKWGLEKPVTAFEVDLENLKPI